MKSIILASSGQFIDSDYIDRLLPKSLKEMKILYVTTASKKVNDTSYVKRTRQKMEELNLTYTEFDIADKSEKELKGALSSNDIVYMEGGNTFYLLKTVRDTNFESIVKDAIEDGLVYWGASAGSYIACPSIVMATWSDRFDRCGIADWTAMKLVPFLINAHYTLDQLETLKKKAKDLEYPLHLLNDEQALVVQEDKIQLVGEGEEITL